MSDIVNVVALVDMILLAGRPSEVTANLLKINAVFNVQLAKNGACLKSPSGITHSWFMGTGAKSVSIVTLCLLREASITIT